MRTRLMVRQPPEPAPPYAALELHRDQVRAGLRTFRPPGALARDKFETAADWERRAVKAPIEVAQAFARPGRAWLTGESPRTRRGRWRRDLLYLEMVEAEAQSTLPSADHQKYEQMVADWRKRKPIGMFARYKALRNQRQRQQVDDGGKISE